MKNILIPTDFSDNGADAYAYALNFVGKEEANFHIVNVVVPISQSIEYPAASSVANNTLVDTARNNLDTLKALENSSDFVQSKIKITTNVLLGRVADAIIREAERVDADMIIMGTTGKGKTNLEKLLGSASSELVTSSRIPVLLIPKGYKFEPLDNLVYATDLNKEDAFHIWKLNKLIQPNVSVVQCLHITDKDSKENNDKIAEFSQFIIETSLNIKTHFHIEKSKDLELAITEFAENYDAEMIVMHKSAKRFWARLFGPKHTKRMTYHLEVPLLVI